MNNQKISPKKVVSLLVFAFILPVIAQAQTAATGSKLMYARELDQIARKTVDSVKKIKLPTAANWEEKYKAAADTLKTADDLDWEAEKATSPPVSLTPLLPLEEYGLTEDDRAFFEAAYAVSGETWTLDRKTKRPKEDNTRLAGICAGILRQDADRMCSSAITAYLEIINSVTSYYVESAGMKTARGTSVATKESLLTEKIGTLYYIAACTGSDTNTADSALSTYHAYAAKYSRLSDEDLVFEYDRLLTALIRQVQEDLSLFRKKVEAEKTAVEAWGTLPAEGSAAEAKAAADRAMDKAAAALTDKKERESAASLAEASLYYGRCRILLTVQDQTQTAVVTETTPDPTLLGGLKKDLTLVKTLLTLGESGKTAGFAQSVEKMIKGTEQLAAGKTEEARKLYADAEKTLTGLVESFSEKSGRQDTSTETDDRETKGTEPVTIDTVEGDLGSHQRAFDGYLTQMATAQEKGDFTAAAEYYRMAQAELAAIESIKTAEARQKILVTKQTFNELLSVTVTLNDGIRPDKKKQGYQASLKKAQDTVAQAEQILDSANEYSEFLRASQLYQAALADLQKINREILTTLKGQLQNDRSALESGSAVQESGRDSTGTDQGQQGTGKPYVLPF